MNIADPDHRPSKLRWVIATLLFFAGAISYMDRIAISVAAPLIAHEMHLNPAQLGIVFSTFFIGYSAFCFVGGWSADRFGPRRVLLVAVLGWSIFCGLTAFSVGLASLLVIRTIFGMFEGPFNSTANKTIGNWFPKQEQGTALGFANCGMPLGAAAAGPIVGFITADYGWHLAFGIISIFGLAWVLVWTLISADTPLRHPWINQPPPVTAKDLPPPPAHPSPTSLLAYITRPLTLATAFAFFGYAYLLFFFLSWFPSYLMMQQHLSLKGMAVVSMIPWLLGALGFGFGGFVSDILYKLTGRPLLARKIILVGGLFTAALCVGLAGILTGIAAAVTLMAISVFAMYLTGPTYFNIILDSVPREKVGGVTGFIHAIANTAGILAPLLTGLIVQKMGGFQSAFLMAGFFALAGAIGVALFVRPAQSEAATVHAKLAPETPFR
ncbi:MFS transporter [Acidocella sp.]|uniref:MFS transporter n=1 Tax=Acidocella sp. TaxID=50710 RepID=UPI00260B859A|nr:MFS transporter [Acidocella sp.]